MKSFRIKNIKSFVDSGEIEIKPITIFVGKNSCGKSSLLRFPAVLAQTFISETDSPLKFYGKMVDYGNFDDVVHKNLKDNEISFELHYVSSITQLLPKSPFNHSAISHLLSNSMFDNCEGEKDFSIAVSLIKDNKLVILKSFSLSIDNAEVYSLLHLKENNYLYTINNIYNSNSINCLPVPFSKEVHVTSFDGFFPVNNFTETRYREYVSLLRSYPDYIAKDDPTTESEEERQIKYLNNSISILDYITRGFKALVSRESNRLSYIGPFRNSPERIYRNQEKQTSFVGAKGENISTLLINDYHKNKTLLNSISEWLHSTMGYIIDIKNVSDSFFQIVVKNEKGISSNIIDVGYGISQILPIVAETLRLISASHGWYKPTLIIEQPELHLHPSAQADLAQLFTIGMDQKKSPCTFLIETHSEHFIRKLQVLISDKNSPLTKEMVKIYYIDKESDGSAKVIEMLLDDDGRFLNDWPKGFFDEANELSQQLLENLLKSHE